MSQILLKLWLIGNRTSCRSIRSVIILVIKQIGLPLRGRPILLITRMITDRIGLHSVLLPLLIIIIIIIIIIVVVVVVVVTIIFAMDSTDFTTPPLVSPRNEVWGTSAEIPYWWRVTTQISVVLLTSRLAREFASTTEKHFADLGGDTSPVWNFVS